LLVTHQAVAWDRVTSFHIVRATTSTLQIRLKLQATKPANPPFGNNE
jgi:hypothetical protein